MTWEELKKLIDDGLKDNGMDDTAELDYIDLYITNYGHMPDFCPDKENNEFSVF